MNQKELEKMLRDQLARHDWWYMMSDDNRYYTAGQTSWTKINETKEKLTQLGMTRNEIAEIHNEFAPDEKQLEIFAGNANAES